MYWLILIGIILSPGLLVLCYTGITILLDFIFNQRLLKDVEKKIKETNIDNIVRTIDKLSSEKMSTDRNDQLEANLEIKYKELARVKINKYNRRYWERINNVRITKRLNDIFKVS